MKVIDNNANSNKYGLLFYGTKETAVVKEIDICLFLENKSWLGKSNGEDFIKTMKETEQNTNISIVLVKKLTLKWGR